MVLVGEHLSAQEAYRVGLVNKAHVRLWRNVHPDLWGDRTGSPKGLTLKPYKRRKRC
jgi:hypothetical protein